MGVWANYIRLPLKYLRAFLETFIHFLKFGICPGWVLPTWIKVETSVKKNLPVAYWENSCSILACRQVQRIFLICHWYRRTQATVGCDTSGQVEIHKKAGWVSQSGESIGSSPQCLASIPAFSFLASYLSIPQNEPPLVAFVYFIFNHSNRNKTKKE